jgi:hypothetical protein
MILRCRLANVFKEVRDAGSKAGGGRAWGEVKEPTSSMFARIFAEKTASKALSKPWRKRKVSGEIARMTDGRRLAYAVFWAFFPDIFAYHVQEIGQIPCLLGRTGVVDTMFDRFEHDVGH